MLTCLQTQTQQASVIGNYSKHGDLLTSRLKPKVDFTRVFCLIVFVPQIQVKRSEIVPNEPQGGDEINKE